MQITRNGLNFTVDGTGCNQHCFWNYNELESISCDLHFDLVSTADVYLNRFRFIQRFEIIDFESLDDLNRFPRWLSIWIDFYGGSWFESIPVHSNILFDFQGWCWFKSISAVDLDLNGFWICRWFKSISAVAFDLNWFLRWILIRIDSGSFEYLIWFPRLMLI